MDVETLGRAVRPSGRDEIAAFIGEPVDRRRRRDPAEPTTTGREVSALCREHDVLLIADEVITGLRADRAAVGLAALRHRARPDHVRQGRHLGLPCRSAACSSASGSARRSGTRPSPGAVFRHGYTYSGHAGAAAAAMANLDILEREDLVERVATLEPVLDARGPPARDGAAASARSGPSG